MSYADIPVRAVAGRLALDFLNTADWSPEGEVVHEKLVAPSDLHIWTGALGLAPILTGSAELACLRAMRRDLRQVFVAVLRGTAADPACLDRLNAWVDAASFSAAPDGGTGTVIATLQGHVLTSARAVLADRREVARLRMCAGSDCGWLFVDESRNARRRWCKMETCGNRAKARRHYASRTARSES